MIQTIAQLIEDRCQQNPDAIAITAPGRRPLTYGGLYAQLQQTLEQLQQIGLQKGDRVAIVLPNGPEMAVAFLAVASFLTSAPLNPQYQESEFDFYLGDLQVRAVIVLDGLASPVRASAAKQGIPLWELLPEAEAGRFRLQLQTNPSTVDTAAAGAEISKKIGEKISQAEPDDVALILHTSGTTARPKMVPLTQANLCASAQQIQITLALSPADRSLNIMPLFHIHGLVGVLLASLVGGGAVICTAGFRASEFFDWWDSQRPTWYSAVPTLHQAILAAAHQDVIECVPLRLIRSSSAALPAPLLQALERTFKAPVIEAYGMTEAAHQMASNPLPPGERRARSVGRATGIELAIMDEAGRLLATGKTGEVVIRGASVMSGYLNQPPATAFTQGWFRTGDRGYLDAEGYLFLQGRLKELINRGGEKIAPLEVDEALLEFPGVLQAVTFALPHPTLGEDVAAAVVPQAGAVLTEASLRQWLFQRLADFKVPSRVVLVEAIPQGATGKIQRIGLAEKLVEALRQPHGEPGTELERLIVEVFAEVLGAKVGIFDNFFGLGGDSLRGTQVVVRLNAKLGLDLANVILFQKPTAAELALALSANLSADLSADPADQSAKPAEPSTPAVHSPPDLTAPVEQPDPQFPRPFPQSSFQPFPQLAADEAYVMPTSFAQQRLWYVSQLVGATATYNISEAKRLVGVLQLEALTAALQVLGQRHEMLRTSFKFVDQAPRQIIHDSVPIAIPLVDLTAVTSASERWATAVALANQEANQPFDLTQPPLLRLKLFRLAADEHLLLICFHHIIADGWSLGLFWRELATCYQAFSRGELPVLPDLPIQYADYTIWQLEQQDWQTDLAYWQQQLRGELLPLQLPNSRPRPPIQTFAGQTKSHRLAPDLTQGLKQLSQQLGATLFMTLLAGFQVLLYRYSAQEDSVVGTPIAGRTQPELEGLIGCWRC